MFTLALEFGLFSPKGKHIKRQTIFFFFTYICINLNDATSINVLIDAKESNKTELWEHRLKTIKHIFSKLIHKLHNILLNVSLCVTNKDSN